jgi:hypothetical protein
MARFAVILTERQPALRAPLVILMCTDVYTDVLSRVSSRLWRKVVMNRSLVMNVHSMISWKVVCEHRHCVP